MSLSKYRLKFPEFKPGECRGVDMKEALETIKFARNSLSMYQTDTGEVEYLFTGFDEELMATLIVLMSCRPRLHQFLKLSVVITDELRKSNKKGIQVYGEAMKFVKENLSEELPRQRDGSIQS